jgi:hypothetical protein
MKTTHFVSSFAPGIQILLSLGVAPDNSVPADEQMHIGGYALDFQLSDLCPLGTAGSANNEYTL